MASGTPCLNSRWDRPKPKDPLQDVVGNESRAVPCHVTPAAPGTSSPAPLACDGSAPPQGGVELAAAMAAKINAMLMAKGKLKPLQPLPSKAAPAALDPDGADELVMAEVDINDVPMNCRDLLTKGKTQEEIRQFSGAVVSTKGLYMSDTHKSSSTGVARPLYLHVQGRSQEEVNKAVIRIKEIISEDILRSAGGQKPPVMPTVPVYRQPPTAAARPTNTPAAPGHKPPPPHSGSFVHTKIFVGLDQCHPSFNVNERVEGPSGSYLQHIQTETGARVFLRGKGSGYIEQASRRESFEPLYLYISHPNAAGLESARRLCTSLLETVRGEHARMMSTFAPAASAAVYPTAGYSAASQSWYSYSSSYSSYPDVSGYWKGCSGPAGQSQLSSSPVQYPVCSRKPSSFILQEDDAVSDGVSSPSGSPKRHFSEEEQKAQIEASADVCVMGSDGSVDSSSERTLMPPPSAPVTAVIRKRVRDETSSAHTAEQQLVKKNKLQDDCGGSLGLVPYGGDSSDEEEERTRSGNKSTV